MSQLTYVVKAVSRFSRKILFSTWLVGFLSLIWFAWRTGTKPSRVSYPCQKIARANIAIFTLPLFIFFWRRFKKCPCYRKQVILKAGGFLLVVLVLGGLIRYAVKVHQSALVPKAIGQEHSRVVWVIDDGATSGWAENSGAVNYPVVEAMMDRGIKALTGSNTVTEAWTQLFTGHNGGADYQPGEKIAIKANFNNSLNLSNCPIEHLPTYQAANALLRQLIVEKGVNQADITFYDATRDFCPYFINGISAVYPQVKLNPSRTCYVSESAMGSPFGCALAEAKYLINMPLLRTHSAAGVTLSFKNHLGSGRSPSRFHDAFFATTASTNSLFQLNSHPYIKDKTILVVADALYGLKAGGPWGNNFGTNANRITPNSIFISKDPVAVDSVMADYLDTQGDYIDNFASDPRTYMQVAAQNGLGTYETNLSFSYNLIDLLVFENDTQPSPSPSPSLSPSPSPSPAPACQADLSGDQVVNLADVVVLLGKWGQTGDLPEDLNNDGTINLGDVVFVLNYWGQNCL